MTIDLYAHRFLAEVERLPRFEMRWPKDPTVWNVAFPAWRPVFDSLLSQGQSSGYRLFSFEEFYANLHALYCYRHPEAHRFLPYFEPPYAEGMHQRAACWYVGGLAEAYVYSVLTEVLEDKAQQGLVLYDSRIDYKQKLDLVVLLSGIAIGVSCFTGTAANRPSLEAHRADVEFDRKRNTLGSSQYGNRQLNRMPVIEIALTESTTRYVNGVPLFTNACLDVLLTRLYATAGISGPLLEGAYTFVVEI